MGKSETVDEDGGILDEDAVWRREEKGSSVLFFLPRCSLEDSGANFFYGGSHAVPLNLLSFMDKF
jgi:hypothetical protein